MGLFNKSKKKEEPAYTQNVPKKASLIETYSYVGEDGLQYLECEYYDSNSDFKKFYDTTKLVICTTPEKLPSGRTVFSAKVAHYDQSDAIYFGDDGQDIGKREQYTNIRLGMDFNKLLTDPEYQKMLMGSLLDKKRVDRYIQTGLQDHPQEQYPCGNYIGYIDINQATGRYGKIFNPKIGEEVHNLPDQVQKREKYKQEQEMSKQNRISRLEAQRAELDKQIAIEKGIYTQDDEER